MYLHLGFEKVIKSENIIGIFDLDNTTLQKSSRDYLAKAEKAGNIENLCEDLPKSFVVCSENGKRKIYITQIASSTILRRVNNGII